MTETTRVPLEKKLVPLLADCPSGYYAVRSDDNDPYTFYRVSRPDKGYWKGVVKVQSKHSDNLNLVMVCRPEKDWYQTFDSRYVRKIVLVAADPIGAGLAFARELEHCCKCGKSLTDANSRRLCIGPECVKKYPEHVAMMERRWASEAEDA